MSSCAFASEMSSFTTTPTSGRYIPPPLRRNALPSAASPTYSSPKISDCWRQSSASPPASPTTSISSSSTSSSWRKRERSSPSPSSPPPPRQRQKTNSSSSSSSVSSTHDWERGKTLAADTADQLTQEEHVGLICRLPPTAGDVPADDEIHRHPDFEAEGNLRCPWNHFVAIIGTGYENGKVCCVMATSFSKSSHGGGITDKYPRPENAQERKRWLLIDQADSGVKPHDNLPTLQLEASKKMPKPTYAVTEHFFFINPKHLTVYRTDKKSKELVHLAKESVNTIIEHQKKTFPGSVWTPDYHPKKT